jgi:hypothetical protein
MLRKCTHSRLHSRVLHHTRQRLYEEIIGLSPRRITRERRAANAEGPEYLCTGRPIQAHAKPAKRFGRFTEQQKRIAARLWIRDCHYSHYLEWTALRGPSTSGRFFLFSLFRCWDCKSHHVAVCFELKFCSAPHNSVRKKACDPYAEMQCVTQRHKPPLFPGGFVVHSPHANGPRHCQP